mgnify:CR=1 FL=1
MLDLAEAFPRDLDRHLAVKPSILVQPMGTLEWHSHHLPLGLDGIVAEAMARAIAERAGAVLAPVSWWAVGGVPFPHTLKLPLALVEPPAVGNLAKKWRTGGYLEKGKVPKDPWDNEFVYISPGLHGDFDLSSYGPDGQAGGEGPVALGQVHIACCGCAGAGGQGQEHQAVLSSGLASPPAGLGVHASEQVGDQGFGDSAGSRGSCSAALGVAGCGDGFGPLAGQLGSRVESRAALPRTGAASPHKLQTGPTVSESGLVHVAVLHPGVGAGQQD